MTTAPTEALRTDHGVVALCGDESAATEAASRLLEETSATGVTLHTATEGWRGDWRAVVRAFGDAGELAGPLADAATIGLYRTTFRRIIEHEVTWDAGEETPGIGMLFAINRRTDMDHQQFDDYWHFNHAPLARRIHIGMWDYVQSSFDEALSDGSPAYDGMAICKCATVEDYKERFYDSPAGRQAIADDVVKFSDVSSSPAIRSVERVLN